MLILFCMQVKGIYNADHKTFLTPPPPKVGDNGNTDTGNGESTGNGENENNDSWLSKNI